MKHAIFLRAVNVGGTSVTSVAAIAKKLGLKNIGAAGTFVAREGTAADLRAAITAELPLQTDIMIVKATEIQQLVAADPFAKAEGRPYVTVLATKPKAMPKLPLEERGIRHLRLDGPFLLSVVLPDAKPGTAPSAERLLGVPGTARGWPTILRVAAALS